VCFTGRCAEVKTRLQEPDGKPCPRSLIQEGTVSALMMSCLPAQRIRSSEMLDLTSATSAVNAPAVSFGSKAVLIRHQPADAA
jgi:hypothetical protein